MVGVELGVSVGVELGLGLGVTVEVLVGRSVDVWVGVLVDIVSDGVDGALVISADVSLAQADTK